MDADLFLEGSSQPYIPSFPNYLKHLPNAESLFNEQTLEWIRTETKPKVFILSFPFHDGALRAYSRIGQDRAPDSLREIINLKAVPSANCRDLDLQKISIIDCRDVKVQGLGEWEMPSLEETYEALTRIVKQIQKEFPGSKMVIIGGSNDLTMGLLPCLEDQARILHIDNSTDTRAHFSGGKMHHQSFYRTVYSSPETISRIAQITHFGVQG